MPVAIMYTVSVYTTSSSGAQTLIEYERTDTAEDAERLRVAYSREFLYPHYLVIVERPA